MATSDDTRWLTSEAAAVYGGWPSVEAFRQWSYRHHLPTYGAGRRRRYLREDIDKAMQPVDWRAYWRKRA